MSAEVAALRLQVARQVAHWQAAVTALADLENFASASAWANLEHQLGVAVRAHLRRSARRLHRAAGVLAAELAAAESPTELERVRRLVVRFRAMFLRVELAFDFYGDCVNSRTTPRLGALLRACDFLARSAMEQVLEPLGHPAPPVLTYVDKGLGASILRAGLRLWDRDSFSVAAAVKITRHNLSRPTAILHEAGHQAAFTLDWNGELADALRRELRPVAPGVADAWAGWASEIAGDAFAFAHAGYAAVAALHDVVAGEPDRVWMVPYGDPHPPAYLRVLLGAAMATRCYGSGPWNDLGQAWVAAHPVRTAPADVREFHVRSAALVPRIAEVCLYRPMRAFGDRPLVACVDPLRVRPDALACLARDAGTALFRSPYWVEREALRLLALSGYRAATEPARAAEITAQFEEWMIRLGGPVEAAA
ncbi:hypothetical protein [Microbispora triticiradicis]|uniref:HEXXH motif domain-containing protein n=2 Tax=Microbispora TaxID=2005 RepID=A0ABY3LUJ0_9ACTN|nr:MULTISPECIES: hypothetical protein [Microbispora]TLP52410.1 hypothetical protein FED44_32400 [Microbispora fusca]TYB55424.1 hypothetical protein FXF59_21210 [Microbispora tritici]